MLIDAFLQGMRELAMSKAVISTSCTDSPMAMRTGWPRLADEIVQLHPAVILAAASGPDQCADRASDLDAPHGASQKRGSPQSTGTGNTSMTAG
jgi:hypothetical protein